MSSSPTAITRRFLEALEAEELDSAMQLLDDDVEYTNVSLPAVRGRAEVEAIFRKAMGPMGFRVHFHAIGADERDPGVVLTERTDALIFGPVHIQFWVAGRFEVRDGLITIWRDSFDWGDVLRGLVRGVIGSVLPAARRRWPD